MGAIVFDPAPNKGLGASADPPPDAGADVPAD